MEFDIKELIAKVHFDYVGPAFPSWWEKNKTKFVLPSLKNITWQLQNGSPYFLRLKVADKSGNTYEFPNEPLVSLSLQKTIVETATVGKERKGTVKEYVCTEDYHINIRGVCVNENPEERNEYPTEQVEELINIFEINDSLEVLDNPFFALFGINRIVLKSKEIEECPGQQGLQKYTFSAVSDQDFYADLTEKAKMVEVVSKINFSEIL